MIKQNATNNKVMIVVIGGLEVPGGNMSKQLWEQYALRFLLVPVEEKNVVCIYRRHVVDFRLHGVHKLHISFMLEGMRVLQVLLLADMCAKTV